MIFADFRLDEITAVLQCYMIIQGKWTDLLTLWTLWMTVFDVAPNLYLMVKKSQDALFEYTPYRHAGPSAQTPKSDTKYNVGAVLTLTLVGCNITSTLLINTSEIRYDPKETLLFGRWCSHAFTDFVGVVFNFYTPLKGWKPLGVCPRIRSRSHCDDYIINCKL